jgi:hypothetical protein
MNRPPFLSQEFMIKDVRRDVLIGAVMLLICTGSAAFLRYTYDEVSVVTFGLLAIASLASMAMIVSGIRTLRKLRNSAASTNPTNISL